MKKQRCVCILVQRQAIRSRVQRSTEMLVTDAGHGVEAALQQIDIETKIIVEKQRWEAISYWNRRNTNL